VEVADMILYLASPASGLVCGQDFLIDGGYTAV
jgi:NAD(P)-dependent dehydrogenase (short-subunit alcohol dehydrogenase family)